MVHTVFLKLVMNHLSLRFKIYEDTRNVFENDQRTPEVFK